MAIDLTVAMPSKVGPASAPWPFGEPRNVSAPSAGDGTPWRGDLGKDLIGFLHSLLLDSGISPNGTPDTALVSQYLNSLKQIIKVTPQLDEVIVNNKLSLSGAYELPIEQDIIGLTTSNDNVALTNQNTQTNFKIVATDALSFTGIAAPDTVVDSRMIILKRDGGTSFTLTDQDTNSTAANRFSFVGGNDLVVASGEFIALLYNPTLSRWELLYRSGAVFKSTGQTITASGLLTLPHGLGVEPSVTRFKLQCTTAEFNWVVGDRVSVGFNSSDASSARYNDTWADSTNIYIRFSNSANPFVFANKTSGFAPEILTAASWQLYVEAEA